jgi:cellobionic acid phosphorylase
LFSGVADAEKAENIINAMRNELYVPYGVRLLAPSYTKYREDVGRISNDPPGVVENGSNYVHGMLFYTFGLACAGYPDEAHDLLCRVLPTNPENPPERALIEPYQITNSFQGPDAAAMSAWRTGSAGWFLKTVWDGLVGIVPDFDGVHVRARIPKAWGDRVAVTRTLRGKPVHFEFVTEEADTEDRSISLRIPNNSILPYRDLKSGMRIQVVCEATSTN